MHIFLVDFKRMLVTETFLFKILVRNYCTLMWNIEMAQLILLEI